MASLAVASKPFFVTNQVSNDELDIKHCPTNDMIGDFYTDPPQGKMFLRFRNLIMGITRKCRVAKIHPFNPITKQQSSSTGVC